MVEGPSESAQQGAREETDEATSDQGAREATKL